MLYIALSANLKKIKLLSWKNNPFSICFFLMFNTFFLFPIFSVSVSAMEPEKVYDMGDIVVTGSSMPRHLSNVAQSLSIISREEIDVLPVSNLSDLLETISGVDVRQRGGHGVQTDVSIRGGSFEQTLILVDGFNMSDSQTGHHNMDLPLNLADIERIEILKGPGARIYGHNAMAGVINIITRDGDQTAVGGHAKYGEYDFYDFSGNASGKIGYISNRISVSKNASTGHIENQETDFDINTLSYKGTVKGKHHRAQMGIGYIEKDFGAYRFYSDTYPNQKENTETLFIYSNAEFTISDVDIVPRIFWRRHEDDFKIQIGAPWFRNKHQSDSYGIQLGTRFETKLGATAIGGEFTVEALESSNLGNHDRQRRGIFIEQKFSPSDRITIGLGTSAMKYSKWGWEYWPGADINVKLLKNINWFASATKSFRAPTYTELFYTTPANQGNPNLKPEKAWTYESGIRHIGNGFGTDISFFYRDSENVIDWSRQSPAEPWKVRNIATHKTRGFELGVDIYPGILANIFHNTVLNLSYTYLDSDRDTDDLESRYVLDHLRHQVNGSLFIDWLGNLTQTLKMRYEKRMNGDSHTVADTRILYQHHPYEFFLDITNILNKTYIDNGFAPAPDRWIIGGIRLHI